MITSNLSHKTFKFPVGELQVTASVIPYRVGVDVTFVFEHNEDIIELLLFVNAAKRQGHTMQRLTIPYVPFSRQDRCNNPGEAFSLKVFCDLVNSLQFEDVVIDDPHSDVTPALLNNCVINPQWDKLKYPILTGVCGKPFWLVSPDAGALKKIYKLAEAYAHTPNFQGVIEANKRRDTKTGEITGTHVPDWGTVFGTTQDHTYVIVDDICDGGRTFIELAKALRMKGAQTVHLYVTHGFFTKGMRVFDGLIDHVYAANDYSDRYLGAQRSPNVQFNS